MGKNGGGEGRHRCGRRVWGAAARGARGGAVVDASARVSAAATLGGDEGRRMGKRRAGARPCLRLGAEQQATEENARKKSSRRADQGRKKEGQQPRRQHAPGWWRDQRSTQPKRMMLGVDTAFGMLNVARCTRNNSTGIWDDHSDFTWHDPDRPRFPASSDCNPVLHKGFLYLLGEDGGLAVYDEHRHDEGFQILDKPQGFCFKCKERHFKIYKESYLFESDQHELMAVLVGHRGSSVNIVRLKEHKRSGRRWRT
ncbi:hypothetical protein BRADI_4g29516v3 [Brachypodium distachyon]|uniref:Uncharacterized protein n=1 Tax=Brachypodium distachyon TaxID=15368 RepID=A0A0Q3LC65_BRADI|nr:hypothetical protein BRADI_4g29516v3 [Brachypodium distachyon]